MDLTYYGYSRFWVETGGKHFSFSPFLSRNELAKGINLKAIQTGCMFVSPGDNDHRLDVVANAIRTSGMVVGGLELFNSFNKVGVKHSISYGDRNYAGQLLLERSLVGQEAIPELISTGDDKLLWCVYDRGGTQQEQGLFSPLDPTSIDDEGELKDRYFSIVCHALCDEYGRINGIINLVVEFTEQVRLQQQNQKLLATIQELTETNARLTRTNVDLDNFIYTASHDLKTPITNIEGLMKLLLQSLPPDAFASERVQKTSHLIAEAIERFKRTIAHLSDITRLEKENYNVADMVNLLPIIREVSLDLAPQMEAANAVLDVAVEPCIEIKFSEKNIRSIVYNLLSNSVKYCSPDRTPFIRIHCQREGAYIVLKVSDNGLGIDLSKRAKLFALFGRLHNHVEGSGVGLYMVNKLVENAGGKIEVQSQVNQGSTFQVYFPA